MLAIGGSDTNGALFSFSFAAVFLVTVLILFQSATKQEFYQHYANLVHQDSDHKDTTVKLTDIIKETWTFNLAVFLNFLVTLGVFPTFHSLAQTTSSNEEWQKYFVPVGCFLVFNVCDLLGRILAHWICWPRASWSGSIITLVFSLARFAFIPLFVFCNVRFVVKTIFLISNIFDSVLMTESWLKFTSNLTQSSWSSTLCLVSAMDTSTIFVSWQLPRCWKIQFFKVFLRLTQLFPLWQDYLLDLPSVGYLWNYCEIHLNNKLFEIWEHFCYL